MIIPQGIIFEQQRPPNLCSKGLRIFVASSDQEDVYFLSRFLSQYAYLKLIFEVFPLA